MVYGICSDIDEVVTNFFAFRAVQSNDRTATSKAHAVYAES